jgi:hypothetical protein
MLEKLAGGIKPGVVEAGQRCVGAKKRQEGDACDCLVPMEANVKETLERPRSAKMFDQCQHVLDPLFETEVAPSEALEPRRPKCNCRGSLATEPALAQ